MASSEDIDGRTHERAGGRSPMPRTAIVIAIVAVALLVYVLGDVLLAVFAAILLAVALDALAGLLVERTPMGRGLALTIVCILLLALLAGAFAFMIPAAIQQISDLWDRLVELIEAGIDELRRFPALAEMMENADPMEAAPTPGTIAGQAFNLVSALASGLAATIIVIAIALFMAASPNTYIRGTVRLVPFSWRARVAETIAASGWVLRWWLIGQLVSMVVLGVSTGIGLYLFGIELWLGLALLTALLTFIPFLGPWIAGVPIVLIAFAEGVGTGIGVTIFYVVLQNIEGSFLVPYIQQRAVHLPAALMIAAQIALGTLFGIAGLILAAPLMAVVLVGVNILYVEGVLGDRRATPDRRIAPPPEAMP